MARRDVYSQAVQRPRARIFRVAFREDTMRSRWLVLELAIRWGWPPLTVRARVTQGPPFWVCTLILAQVISRTQTLMGLHLFPALARAAKAAAELEAQLRRTQAAFR